MSWGAINLHQLMKQGLVRKLGILLWFVTHAVYLYFVIIFTNIAGLHIVEQSLWKGVPHYLRRVSSSLKKVHANSTCEGLGASRPPSILIRRRPSNAGRETPRTLTLSDLGSGAISWNSYPGRDRYPLGRETVTPGRARLTTQPKLSGAQWGGFFSHRRGNSPRWGFEPPTCGVPPVASHHSG